METDFDRHHIIVSTPTSGNTHCNGYNGISNNSFDGIPKSSITSSDSNGPDDLTDENCHFEHNNTQNIDTPHPHKQITSSLRHSNPFLTPQTSNFLLTTNLPGHMLIKYSAPTVTSCMMVNSNTTTNSNRLSVIRKTFNTTYNGLNGDNNSKFDAVQRFKGEASHKNSNGFGNLKVEKQQVVKKLIIKRIPAFKDKNNINNANAPANKPRTRLYIQTHCRKLVTKPPFKNKRNHKVWGGLYRKKLAFNKDFTNFVKPNSQDMKSTRKKRIYQCGNCLTFLTSKSRILDRHRSWCQKYRNATKLDFANREKIDFVNNNDDVNGSVETIYPSSLQECEQNNTQIIQKCKDIYAHNANDVNKNKNLLLLTGSSPPKHMPMDQDIGTVTALHNKRNKRKNYTIIHHIPRNDGAISPISSIISENSSAASTIPLTENYFAVKPNTDKNDSIADMKCSIKSEFNACIEKLIQKDDETNGPVKNLMAFLSPSLTFNGGDKCQVKGKNKNAIRTTPNNSTNDNTSPSKSIQEYMETLKQHYYTLYGEKSKAVTKVSSSHSVSSTPTKLNVMKSESLMAMNMMYYQNLLEYYNMYNGQEQNSCRPSANHVLSNNHSNKIDGKANRNENHNGTSRKKARTNASIDYCTNLEPRLKNQVGIDNGGFSDSFMTIGPNNMNLDNNMRDFVISYASKKNFINETDKVEDSPISTSTSTYSPLKYTPPPSSNANECSNGFGNNVTNGYSASNNRRQTTNQGKHLCLECGKRFNTSYHLKRHSYVHTGLKPYNCTHCFKAFAERSHFVNHTCRVKPSPTSLNATSTATTIMCTGTVTQSNSSVKKTAKSQNHMIKSEHNDMAEANFNRFIELLHARNDASLSTVETAGQPENESNDINCSSTPYLESILGSNPQKSDAINDNNTKIRKFNEDQTPYQDSFSVLNSMLQSANDTRNDQKNIKSEFTETIHQQQDSKSVPKSKSKKVSFVNDTNNNKQVFDSPAATNFHTSPIQNLSPNQLYNSFINSAWPYGVASSMIGARPTMNDFLNFGHNNSTIKEGVKTNAFPSNNNITDFAAKIRSLSQQMYNASMNNPYWPIMTDPNLMNMSHISHSNGINKNPMPHPSSVNGNGHNSSILINDTFALYNDKTNNSSIKSINNNNIPKPVFNYNNNSILTKDHVNGESSLYSYPNSMCNITSSIDGGNSSVLTTPTPKKSGEKKPSIPGAHKKCRVKKLHPCDACGKEFRDSYHLKRHYYLHTGKKPFNCDRCGKSYAEQSHLRIHKCKVPVIVPNKGVVPLASSADENTLNQPSSIPLIPLTTPLINGENEKVKLEAVDESYADSSIMIPLNMNDSTTL